MVTIQDLFNKYENSSRWLLICPLLDNGQVKMKCYMSKTKNWIFQDCYTYIADLEILMKFVQSNSYGQAYNGVIKQRQQRIGFKDGSNHEKGLFTKKDIIQTMVEGRTKLLLEIVTLLQSRHNIETNMKQLVEHKRKKELEAEFDVFYNYKKGGKMELKDYFEMLPTRYHNEFKEHIVDKYSIKKIDKVFSYFVEEIIDELSDKEKSKIFV